MIKTYVTIIQVSNPKGPVTVNEQYLPLGTCRRYEKGKLFGSVMYPSWTKEVVNETLKRHASVKNMQSVVTRYKRKPEALCGGLFDYDLIGKWQVREGIWYRLA